MASIRLRAFAKINLSLRIKGARPDGFHEIQTIFQTIDLHDRIKCETRRGPFALRCSTPGVPNDHGNLVWKAAQHLWTAGGRDGEPRDAIVTLNKNIPMQAGLGGGSSDAAATLLGLRQLWKLRVDDQTLQLIAAKLGSDVPFFLIGGAALGLERGDEVYPLENLPRLWVVLALPPFGVATKDAYAWWDLHTKKGASLPFLRENLSGPVFPGWLGTVPLLNDFEGPVIERHPVIGTLKEQLRNEGAVMAAMSGSGSTVFGVFRSGAAAAGAVRRLKRSGVDVRAARFQPRKTV